jgi:hypothetical protein
MNDIPTRAPAKAPEISIDTRTGRAESNATTDVERISHESVEAPMSPRNFQNPFSRAQTSLDMDDYFVRPSKYKL